MTFPTFKQLLLRIGLSCISIGLTVWLCLFTSEFFFFDRFYYKKSPEHGYKHVAQDYLLGANDNHPAIESRLVDLRSLFSLHGTTEDSDNTLTVVVIGDSFVYGTGVKDTERFPVILEKLLNKQFPTRVYSLAQPGDSVLDNYMKYQLAKEKFHPDITIIGLWSNDLIVTQDKYPDQELVYTQLKNACPQEELSYGSQPSNAEVEDLEQRSLKDQYANLCFLDEIARMLQQEDILFYSYMPISLHTDPNLNGQPLTGWEDIFTSVIEKHGHTVSSPENLDQFTYKQVSTREAHPSRATHHLYAKSLEKLILDRLSAKNR